MTHAVAGRFQHGFDRVAARAVGAILGAQIAARLSRRIGGQWIMRSLAAGLALVGLRLIIGS